MKKFNWKCFDFGPDLEVDTRLGIKNDKSNVSNEEDNSTEIVQSFNFHGKITPKTVEDLAVHSKKVEDVQKWLTQNLLNEEMKSPFLLLSGPSGCAKTTTLNVLCKQLSISVAEWINPTDKDTELIKGANMKRFTEFLADSKWQSLFENEVSRKITLVKDFPNAVIYQPGEFFSVLSECFKLKCPIVFICTDANGNGKSLMRTLFTEDIVNEYNITHISFNACAPSLMKRAMKRAQFILQENMYRQPLPSTIDAILNTAMGDIRNAMNQFYLECLLGTDILFNKESGNINNKRKRQCETPSFRSQLKDKKLGLFHGLGKVLNPKRKEVDNSWRLNCDTEKLVAEFSTQPTLVIMYIFENYLKYFGNIDDASHAADILSTSLKFLNNLTEKHEVTMFGLWISILGLMVFNEHKVSKWNQIRGPIGNFNIETIRLKPMDNFYSDIIRNTSTYHKFENVI